MEKTGTSCNQAEEAHFCGGDRIGVYTMMPDVQWENLCLPLLED